jgi:hypothetical protein
MAARADTIDEETRSVEAVLSSQEVVQVWDWSRFQIIDEVLLARGAELPDQVVLLENHRRWSLDDVIGSARSLRIEGDITAGRLFFDDDGDRADRAWGKYRRGHVRDVSVGYKAIDYVDIAPGQRKTVDGVEYQAKDRVLRITRKWKLREVSATPIGADEQAKTRTDSLPTKEGSSMSERLRKYLESQGLRSDASEEDARHFLTMLSGQRAQIANLLESEGESETSKFAVRAAVEKLGVDPDDPSKPLPSDGQGTASRSEAGAGAGGESEGTGESSVVSVDPDAIRAEERERIAMIDRVGGQDLSEDTRAQAVREGWDEARVSGATLQAIRDNRSESVGPAIHSRGREQDVTARSLAAGLLIGQAQDPLQHSMFREDLPGPSDRLTEQDADRGHALRGLSAPDLVRECLRIDTGKSYRTIDDAFLALRSAATSGGTLSYVFGTNVYARLIAGWETVGDTTVGWCDEEDVANFQEQEDISVEGSADLERLPRGDTAKHATISDTHETYKIARYAKQFAVDEQDIIDDRLGAIMRMPGTLGKAARRLRPDMVYSIMLENPNLVADSGAVFNATAVTTSGGHANLGTAALASGALKTAITAMVQQRLNRTATEPGEALTLRPRWLIVPAALEWTARELTASAALAKLFADSSDPWYTQLNLLAEEGIRTVIDDRIGAIGVKDPRTKTVRTGLDTNWFLTAGGEKGLRVAYRRGTGRRPAMRRFNLTQGQWGVGWDINLDIGVAFLDYRPWYMSDGTV